MWPNTLKVVSICCKHQFRHSFLCRSLGGVSATINSNTFLLQNKENIQLDFPRTVVSINRPTANQLWKSVTGISNAGKNRGRARANRRARSKNLNFGQIIGVGEKRMQFPGLNAPLFDGTKLRKLKELPADPQYVEKINLARNSMGKFRSLKLTSLERGWSGTHIRGRLLGPPFPDPEFEGWETIVLESSQTSRMSGQFNRLRFYRCICVVGNRNGLAGFAIKEGNTPASSLQRAKTAAVSRLFEFKRDGDTIYHDSIGEYGVTKVTLSPSDPGSGFKGSRVVRAICDVIGLKDVDAKVYRYGSTERIVKATLIALLKQKSHQETSDKKQLIVTATTPGERTVVIAKPSDGYVRTEKELSPTEELNYMQYASEGLVTVYDSVPVKPYIFESRFQRFLRKMEHKRHHNLIRFRLAVHYGSVKGPYSDQYIEANERNFELIRALGKYGKNSQRRIK